MASADSDVNMVPAGEGSSGAGPSSTNPTSSSKKPKRFEIKKWNAVSLWAWGIILWICALSVKLTKPVLQAKNVRLPGVFAIMPFTSTALADGSRHVKFAHWITASGNSRNMGIRSHSLVRNGVFSFCSWLKSSREFQIEWYLLVLDSLELIQCFRFYCINLKTCISWQSLCMICDMNNSTSLPSPIIPVDTKTVLIILLYVILGNTAELNICCGDNKFQLCFIYDK